MKKLIAGISLSIFCSLSLAQELEEKAKPPAVQIVGNTEIRASVRCGPGTRWLVVDGKETCEFPWATELREKAETEGKVPPKTTWEKKIDADGTVKWVNPNGGTPIMGNTNIRRKEHCAGANRWWEPGEEEKKMGMKGGCELPFMAQQRMEMKQRKANQADTQ